MYIRPVTLDDSDAVVEIAKAAGVGMTSLPAHAEVIAEKIARSVQSFNAPSPEHQKEGLYFFVLEDPDTHSIVGTCSIDAYVGLRRPFYSYKLTTVTQHSDMLDIYSRNDILQVVNDYTGVSEIGSLFLLPEYRRDRLGRLLSRVRFLFMGLHPELFSSKVIAEIRGWHDGAGNSPFYDSLAKYFFQIPFTQADWLCATQGNKFISELMPPYPIYVNLLPKEAQECIGRPYVNSEPAKAMLEREGFTYNNYVDIFDGGPTLEAKVKDIHTITTMQRACVTELIESCAHGERVMLARPDFADFRATIGFIQPHEKGGVALDARTATLLNITLGEDIVYASA
jgi:arginine N-succinyltransferase